MTEKMERIWLRIPRPLLAIIEARAQSLNLRTQDVMRNALAYGLAATDPAMVTHPPGRSDESPMAEEA